MTKPYGFMDAVKDAATGKLEIAGRDMATARYEVCLQCPFFTAALTCKLCGCFMPAKVKLVNATCPDAPPRWE